MRELKFGSILHQAALLSTVHQTLASRLPQPVKDLGYRVRGLVSDDEKALQLAAARDLSAVVGIQVDEAHCTRPVTTRA